MNILNMEGGASQSLRPKAGQYVFFLGGNDAEMETIRDRLKKTNHTVIDKNLGWGAKATVYEAEIQEAILEGKVPVLVELSTEGLSESLQGLLVAGSIKVIDHHGEKAQEKASILQVIELLGDVPSRIEAIIAANDSGYIPGMQQVGASQEEIATVRALERKIQGITEEMEQEAIRAIDNMERFPELNNLIIVRMKHSKSATVTDRLHGTQEKEHILILSEDGEANYYGDGAICTKLKEKFEGWNGGSGLGKAGETAFWGGYQKQDEIEKFIKDIISIKILSATPLPVSSYQSKFLFPETASRYAIILEQQKDESERKRLEIVARKEDLMQQSLMMEKSGSNVSLVQQEINRRKALAFKKEARSLSFPNPVSEGDIQSILLKEEFQKILSEGILVHSGVNTFEREGGGGYHGESWYLNFFQNRKIFKLGDRFFLVCENICKADKYGPVSSKNDEYNYISITDNLQELDQNELNKLLEIG